ncbi:MAG TPA: mechanosensitive ion channel [Aliiroseovarius sp.]|nr:mechanosensitive ion channel [Aliiroseovarius sp.]
MKFPRLILLILSLTLMIPALVHAQDGTISTETGTALIEQDAAMAVKIREIISELDGYDDVTVAVSSGVVTLRGTTLEASAGEKLVDLVERIDGVVAIENNVTTSTDLAERISPAVERFLSRVKQVLAFIPLALVGLFAFGLIVFIGFFVARQKNPWDKLAPNPFIADIYRTIIRLAFISFGVVVALDILGATALLSTILGAAGIIGLALGFAVRDTVENFIASLLLSIRQPFRPNDTIEIGGDVGKVIRLTSRATILLSLDGNHIRIPNATVFKSRIINYTRNRGRRFQFPMHIPANEDPGKALDRGVAELQRLDFVLEKPAPTGWIENVDNSGTNLCFAGWIDQHESHFQHARGEAMRLLKLALEKPRNSRAKAPEVRDVSAQKAGAEDADLIKLVESDREANSEGDLLTRDGMDE